MIARLVSREALALGAFWLPQDPIPARRDRLTSESMSVSSDAIDILYARSRVKRRAIISTNRVTSWFHVEFFDPGLMTE
jgi:hypothetical protein